MHMACPWQPQLAGLREGFTSLSSQEPQGWPLQLAGLLQPPSHQAFATSDSHTLSTLQLALKNPYASLGPWSVYQHTALGEQPTQIPCCCLDVDLKPHWSCVEPSSPVGHNTVSGLRWLDCCLQSNFKLIEIGVDRPFPLLRDAQVTGRKSY